MFIPSFLLGALLLHQISPTHANTSRVHCETTKGPIAIQVHHDWAPLGAERFMKLVHEGFYTDIAFYRCVEGFLTQFGISDRKEMSHWHLDQIKDDPNIGKGIRKHYVSFAGGGPNTRSTQIFIAFEDLDFLGKEPWETAFGEVVEGAETLQKLYKGYGDISPFNKNGPDQVKLFNRGNAYIREEFPLIDFLLSCEDVSDDRGKEGIQSLQKEEEADVKETSGEDADEEDRELVQSGEGSIGLTDKKEAESSERKEPEVLKDAGDDEEEEERLYVSSAKQRLRLRSGVSSILPLYIGFVVFVLVLLFIVYRSSLFRLEIYSGRSKTT